MSGVDVGALRKAAERAHNEAPDLTWQAERRYDGVYGIDLGPATHAKADSYEVGADCIMPREMAQFIAAANPTVVLALLDRASELEEVVERVRGLLAESRVTPNGRVPIPAGDLRDALKGPRRAQEAAQGDGSDQVVSESTGDANGAQAAAEAIPLEIHIAGRTIMRAARDSEENR